MVLERPLLRLHALRERVKRTCSGVKLLWANEDWDYGYLLDLLHWKLKRMETAISKGPHLERDKVAKNIRKCTALLQRISHDDYISEEHAALLQKWWETRTEIEKPHDITQIVFKKDAKLEKALARHAEKAKQRAQQDWDLLFKLLHKHMKTWWC